MLLDKGDVKTKWIKRSAIICHWTVLNNHRPVYLWWLWSSRSTTRLMKRSRVLLLWKAHFFWIFKSKNPPLKILYSYSTMPVKLIQYPIYILDTWYLLYIWKGYFIILLYASRFLSSLVFLLYLCAKPKF